MISNSNTNFSFEKLSDNNMNLLTDWFKEPHVNKWWPTPEENESKEHFLKRIRSKNTFGYIINLNNIPIGLYSILPYKQT